MKHMATRFLAVFSGIVLAILSGCKDRELKELPDDQLALIVEGLKDPHEHRELLAANTARVAKVMRAGLYQGLNARPLPLLSSLSYDWGNYADSVYFSKLSMERDGYDQGSAKAYLLDRYFEGGTNVHQELEKLFPAENIFWFRDFEPLLTFQGSEAEFRERLREMLFQAGNIGPDLLIAFVSHADFRPDFKTLLYIEAEACWLFDSLGDLKCADVDAGKVNLPLSKSVKNTKGRYFFFSLFSSEVARHWRRLGEPDSAVLWEKRAMTSYQAAKSADDWEVAWEAHARKRDARLSKSKSELK